MEKKFILALPSSRLRRRHYLSVEDWLDVVVVGNGSEHISSLK